MEEVHSAKVTVTGAALNTVERASTAANCWYKHYSQKNSFTDHQQASVGGFSWNEELFRMSSKLKYLSFLRSSLENHVATRAELSKKQHKVELQEKQGGNLSNSAATGWVAKKQVLSKEKICSKYKDEQQKTTAMSASYWFSGIEREAAGGWGFLVVPTEKHPDPIHVC